ncbi:MAG: hypothetical protein PHF20_09620 [Halothiobacillaceae bacterium]|nr:hypothetical protein [Halothiobacillaceae bacterium]
MSPSLRFIAGLSLLFLLWTGRGIALEVEDARSTGCLPRQTPQQTCAACHPQDAAQRMASARNTPCTPYCATCHKGEEMARHHTVGSELSRTDAMPLHLGGGQRIACATCHDLSRQRYDSVRWKAGSLFDRLFRDAPRYKTYFLSMRNDQGQLCLTCH